MQRATLSEMAARVLANMDNEPLRTRLNEVLAPPDPQEEARLVVLREEIRQSRLEAERLLSELRAMDAADQGG